MGRHVATQKETVVPIGVLEHTGDFSERQNPHIDPAIRSIVAAALAEYGHVVQVESHSFSATYQGDNASEKDYYPLTTIPAISDAREALAAAAAFAEIVQPQLEEHLASGWTFQSIY